MPPQTRRQEWGTWLREVSLLPCKLFGAVGGFSTAATGAATAAGAAVGAGVGAAIPTSRETDDSNCPRDSDEG